MVTTPVSWENESESLPHPPTLSPHRRASPGITAGYSELSKLWVLRLPELPDYYLVFITAPQEERQAELVQSTNKVTACECGA